jgi:hypothetical protein
MRSYVTAAVAVAALIIAAPAGAATTALVAAGQGTTTCTVEMHKFTDTGSIWTGGESTTEFRGTTDCSVPVDQTAHAFVAADADSPTLDGGFCSGVRTTCTSGLVGWGFENGNPMTYEIYLRAPSGQSWVGDPSNCTGVGTGTLRCSFTVEDLTRFGV